MKVAVGELTPSLAVTCLLPAVSIGTLNVAEKPPLALAINGKGVVKTDFPSNVTVIFEFETKFEPVTVTVVPKEPDVGFRVTLEAITVKLVEAVLKLVSVIVTRFFPSVEPAGTVKTAPALILPFASVVPLKETGNPLNVATSLELSAKPLPATVTGSPEGPLLGESVRGEPPVNFTASATISQGTTSEPELVESVQFTDQVL